MLVLPNVRLVDGLRFAPCIIFLVAVSLVLPVSLGPSHPMQAIGGGTTVIATSDNPSTPSIEAAAATRHKVKPGFTHAPGVSLAAGYVGGGVYSCDLGSGTCTRKVALDWPDNVLCSVGTSCLVAVDDYVEDGGGIYLCDLASSKCILKVALKFASDIVCPTENTCIVSSDPPPTEGGGGLYACDLVAGACTMKAALDYVDSVTCLSGSSCIATQDMDGYGGAVYACDLGTGTCTQAAPLGPADLLGASGLACSSATNCIVTTDAPVGFGGGIYSCDLGTGICTFKVALEWADFMTCPSPNSCLVTRDDDLAAGGGIYACDVAAGECTLNVALGYASGIQLVPSAPAVPVGGVVEQINLPSLLAGWTLVLAVFAVMTVLSVVAFRYEKKRLARQRKK
jgi:hypothetical protein